MSTPNSFSQAIRLCLQMGDTLSISSKIAKEMLNVFGRGLTPPPFCISTDLKKTFDSISWIAIDVTLEAMGFSSELQHNHQHCYVTPSFSILVDGEPLEMFRSQWGLRHGDPISPLLFNLSNEEPTPYHSNQRENYTSIFCI